MTVDWSEGAVAQLTAIRDYIARDSPTNAEALAERIVRRTESLADFPQMGGAVPEYPGQGVREVLERPYRILYRIEGDRVQIVAVVHGSRRLPRTPPG